MEIMLNQRHLQTIQQQYPLLAGSEDTGLYGLEHGADETRGNLSQDATNGESDEAFGAKRKRDSPELYVHSVGIPNLKRQRDDVESVTDNRDGDADRGQCNKPLAQRDDSPGWKVDPRMRAANLKVAAVERARIAAQLNGTGRPQDGDDESNSPWHADRRWSRPGPDGRRRQTGPSDRYYGRTDHDRRRFGDHHHAPYHQSADPSYPDAPTWQDPHHTPSHSPVPFYHQPSVPYQQQPYPVPPRQQQPPYYSPFSPQPPPAYYQPAAPPLQPSPPAPNLPQPSILPVAETTPSAPSVTIKNPLEILSSSVTQPTQQPPSTKRMVSLPPPPGSIPKFVPTKPKPAATTTAPTAVATGAASPSSVSRKQGQKARVSMSFTTIKKPAPIKFEVKSKIAIGGTKVGNKPVGLKFSLAGSKVAAGGLKSPLIDDDDDDEAPVPQSKDQPAAETTAAVTLPPIPAPGPPSDTPKQAPPPPPIEESDTTEAASTTTINSASPPSASVPLLPADDRTDRRVTSPRHSLTRERGRRDSRVSLGRGSATSQSPTDEWGRRRSWVVGRRGSKSAWVEGKGKGEGEGTERVVAVEVEVMVTVGVEINAQFEPKSE
ncbi:hypothetical protein HK104_004861 [Borealophlyctis nickersoniae]|nr:hypothetical protein HK104_004861 [Borealophlyctis nickersoniae]